MPSVPTRFDVSSTTALADDRLAHRTRRAVRSVGCVRTWTSYPNNKYYLYYSGSENSGRFRAITPPAQRGHRAKGPGALGQEDLSTPGRIGGGPSESALSSTLVLSLLTNSEGRVVGVRATHTRRRPGLGPAPLPRDTPTWPSSRASTTRRCGPRWKKLLNRLERRYARTVDIHVRQAVILSAGGYIANREWIAEHAPQYRDGLPLGTSADDGGGITLAADVGAAVDRLDNVSAWRFITPPSAFLGALVVDEDGQRFIDETRYGAAVGHAMIQEHGGRGWILADHGLLKEARAQLPQQAIWFQRLQMEAMLRTDRVVGDTLEEVAAKAGVDPAGLRATVEAHNAAAAAGLPDPQGSRPNLCTPSARDRSR